MVIREDLRGGELAPKFIQDLLLGLGGLTPFGEPLYRCVLAQHRYTQEAGHMQEWRPEATLAERGGMVTGANQHGEPTQVESTEKPVRVVSGMQWVHKYFSDDGPLLGWIIERWYDPANYGSQSAWSSPEKCMEDGTPLLGPYPQYGEYEMIAGPAGEVPSPEEIGHVIALFEYNLQARLNGSGEWRRLERLKARRQQEEKRQEAAKRETFLKLREQFGFMKSSSPEAGRLREELAQRIRRRGGSIGHVGN